MQLTNNRWTRIDWRKNKTKKKNSNEILDLATTHNFTKWLDVETHFKRKMPGNRQRMDEDRKRTDRPDDKHPQR